MTTDCTTGRLGASQTAAGALDALTVLNREIAVLKADIAKLTRLRDAGSSKAVNRAIEVMGENAGYWLRTYSHGLGAAPIDLLFAGKQDAVILALDQAFYGVYA